MPSVFIGYLVQLDSYLWLDPVSHQIFSSRDVTFDELDFSLNTKLSEGPLCNEVSDWGKISVTSFGNQVVDSSCSEYLTISPNKMRNVNIESPPEVTPMVSRLNDLLNSGGDISATDTQNPNLNNDSLAVRGSLVDEFPINESTKSDSDSPVDSAPIM